MKNKPLKTEIFINECSLQGQFQTPDEFEKAVANLIAVFDFMINRINPDAELYKGDIFGHYKKGDIFVDFKAIKHEIVKKSFNKLRHDIQVRFKRLLSGKLKDWRNQRLHQPTDKYTLVEIHRK